MNNISLLKNNLTQPNLANSKNMHSVNVLCPKNKFNYHSPTNF